MINVFDFCTVLLCFRLLNSQIGLIIAILAHEVLFEGGIEESFMECKKTKDRQFGCVKLYKLAKS